MVHIIWKSMRGCSIQNMVLEEHPHPPHVDSFAGRPLPLVFSTCLNGRLNQADGIILLLMVLLTLTSDHAQKPSGKSASETGHASLASGLALMSSNDQGRIIALIPELSEDRTISHANHTKIALCASYTNMNKCPHRTNVAS